MAYIDLVLCEADDLEGKTERFLRKAPEFSGIKKDDEIFIEYRDDMRAKATVVDSISINPKSEEAEFICHCFDIEPEELKKVISVTKVQELKYQEEEDG